MPTSLVGLPTMGGAKMFLSDYAVRSGLLDQLGWFDAARQISIDFKGFLDAGDLKAERSAKFGVVFTNTASRLTSEYRVCLSPSLMRHQANRSNGVIPADVVREMAMMSNIKWEINPEMFEIVLAQPTNIQEDVILKNPIFVECAQVSLENGGHYLPVYTDKVLRTYAEGGLSYTSDKMVRNCQDIAEKITYTKADLRRLCPMLGLSPDMSAELISRSSEILADQGQEGFALIRHAVWVQEVLRGEPSGAMVGCDIRTSGPLLGAILAGCLDLMMDCNVYGQDDRDCRDVVSGRVRVPTALLPWRDEVIRLAKKPLITQLFYGQAAAGGAVSLFWKDEKTAPHGWISSLGIVNVVVCNEHKDSWNPDFVAIITALGAKEAMKAFRALSESFNTTFWASYPDVLQLRQKLEAAHDFFVRKNDKKPTFTAPNGAQYTHSKWEIKGNGTPYRFRYDGSGAEKPLDISLMEMIDTASGFSCFVRLVHFLDAWFRNRVSLKVIKGQVKRYGKYIGHGAVHDNWIVPIMDAPVMHGIVRSVLHEAINLLPDMINQFLSDNGQEPMRLLNNRDLEKIHQSISKNRAFLSIN